MTAFLRDDSNDVTLRIPTKEDAPALTEWVNSQELRPMIRAWLPASLEAEISWIESLQSQSKPPKDIAFIIVKGDAPVGICGLHQIAWDWRCCTIGIFIASPTGRKQKIGRSAYSLVLNYAFCEMGLNVVEAEVYSVNEPSLGFHCSMGFREVGVSDPKVLFCGAHVPMHTFSMTAERWLART